MSSLLPTLPLPTTTKDIKPSAEPSHPLLDLYLPESLQISWRSSETKTLKTREWRLMVQEWRREQLLRACLAHSHRSVYPLPATSQKYCADTTGRRTTAMTAKYEKPTLSLSALPEHLNTSWGPSLEVRPQLGQRSHTTKKDIKWEENLPQKMTKMPRQFHKYAKLPKGWAIARVRDKEEEEIVWNQQKQALSGFTIPERRTQSASRSSPGQSLQSPMDLT